MNNNRTRLAIFDIDGTLTHTAAIADRVFVQTVAEFLHVLCDDIEWPSTRPSLARPWRSRCSPAALDFNGLVPCLRHGELAGACPS